jgi:hypothetical protein
MRLSRPNQKGFISMELFLIVMVAIIVGGTGYFVYQATKKTNDTFSAAAKAAASSPETNTKPKTATSAHAVAVDDKTAILASIKSYMSQKLAGEPSSAQITFDYTVNDIVGVNAMGSIRASQGDPQVYYAHKTGTNWGIVYSGHLAPQDHATCTKYNMPSDWCATFGN